MYVFIISIFFYLRQQQSKLKNYLRNETFRASHIIQDKQYIFIGGYEKSGKSLIQSVLKADSSNYDSESQLIFKYIRLVKNHQRETLMNSDISSAHSKKKNLDLSSKLFINSLFPVPENNKTKLILMKNGKILYFMEYLKEIFDDIKFIYVVRDPRSVIFSLTKRFKGILKYKKIDQHFRAWNIYNEVINRMCILVGEYHCIRVHYEHLVANPKVEFKKIHRFIGLENYTIPYHIINNDSITSNLQEKR